MSILPKQRILLFGADGMLGGAVARCLKDRRFEDRSFELIESPEIDCDITEKDEAVLHVMTVAPHIVINCAGYTDVDGSEANTTLACQVNADGPAYLAEACDNIDARLIHISTEYVFDGAKDEPYVEDDAANPISEYGKSKAAGERAIVKRLRNHVILRTSWLYGPDGKNFVDTVLKLADEKDEITMVNDQRGAPTYTPDLAEGIYRVCKSDITGIYHLAGAGYCTWYEFAETALDLKGKKLKMRPVTTDQLDRPAKRPLNCMLDCSKIERDAGIKLRPWQDALKDYLQ
ncbi:MAG: dTDP-4-dehydrorhamnose reductase [Planctomycetota bacterium]